MHSAKNHLNLRIKTKSVVARADATVYVRLLFAHIITGALSRTGGVSRTGGAVCNVSY